MGAASLQAPSPLQSATGTQFNVATVAGHWQLALDLIDAQIEVGSPAQDSPLKSDASATRPFRRQEQNPFS